jgi:hypothetical protein
VEADTNVFPVFVVWSLWRVLGFGKWNLPSVCVETHSQDDHEGLLSIVGHSVIEVHFSRQTFRVFKVVLNVVRVQANAPGLAVITHWRYSYFP